MSKDFAFMFYPGDYLRDTQCLSESVQVAYDRIMCEHMRNICISHAQLKFFTKKLSDDEKAELLSVLTPIEGGFQIDWVVASITKRKAYSESRAKNRQSKKKKDMSNTSYTYDSHMEDENENEFKGINGTRALEEVTKTAKVLSNPDGYKLIKAALERQFTNESQIELIRGECKFRGDVRAEIVHFASHYADNGLAKKKDHEILNRFRAWLIKSKQFNKQEETIKPGFKLGDKPTQRA